MTKFPKIEIEYRQRGDDDPTPYQANIVGDGFDHHGIGASPSEALLLAASHWHARLVKKRDGEAQRLFDQGRTRAFRDRVNHERIAELADEIERGLDGPNR